MISIVIFDLDGTLYRTHETCLPPLYALCEKYGVRLSGEDERFLLYTTADALLQRAAPEMTPEDRAEFGHALKWLEIEEVQKHGRLFDGVENLLAALHRDNIPMMICGMGSREYIEAVLARCNIGHYFSHVLCRKEGLPKAQVLGGFLKERGMDPGGCLVVGDSVTDLNAARENGVAFLGVGYGYGVADIGPYIVADDPAGLTGEIYKALTYTRIEKRLNTLPGPVILGISGVDTSGKTRFSADLDKYLALRGRHTALIHLDDFHNPRAVRNADASPQGYIDRAFDLDRLARLLADMKDNPGKRELDLLDLDTDLYKKRAVFDAGPDTVVIVEGVMLSRPPLEGLFDYMVFLDIGFDEVLKRAEIRDVPKYGAEFLNKYTDRYIPAQKIYLEKYGPKEKCDLLIDNRDYTRPVVLREGPCPADNA